MENDNIHLGYVVLYVVSQPFIEIVYLQNIKKKKSISSKVLHLKKIKHQHKKNSFISSIHA